MQNGNEKELKQPAPGLAGSNQVMVHNALSLDAKTPIPLDDYKGTAFRFSKNKSHLPFLNPSDTFAQFLLEAKLLSPTNFACVSSKTNFSIGKGWYQKNVDNEDKELTEWAKSLNRKNQSLNEILKSVFDNLYTTGNAYAEIVRGTVGTSKFIKVVLNSFLDCRLSAPDDDDICTSIFKSKSFRRNGVWSLRNDYVEIPIYSSNILDKPWFKDENGNEHTVIHLKNNVSGYDYYGMPSNVASLPQQILEYKSSRYNIDNFDNNLVIGGAIILQGNLTQEEANKLGQNIIYQHSGDGKRGRYVILSSENGIENSKIIPFDKQSDGSFIELDKRAEEKIILANEWDQCLLNMSSSAGLGKGSGYIRSIYEVKKNEIIEPMQNYVIEKLLQPLMKISSEWLGKKWGGYEFGIKNAAPISFAGDIDVNAIVTKDEGREMIGLQKMGGDAEKVFIKESKQLSFFNNVQN